MKESQLINKLSRFKKIKPEPNFVLETKLKILKDQKSGSTNLLFIEFLQNFFFSHRLALAGISIFAIITIGIFGFSQNALPGDAFYSIKKATEQIQIVIVPEKEKPKVQLEIAQKRLKELEKIAKEDKIQNLAPAIKEYQESVKLAVKDLKKTNKKIDEKFAKEIVEITQEIQKTQEKIEKTLATEISSEELNQATMPYYQSLAESLIKDLEKRSLTQEQLSLLKKAKELFEKKDYQSAFEKALELPQPKN
jgi:hypothetical protein